MTMKRQTREKLKQFTERLVAINEEKAACAEDEREVLNDAAEAGFNKKAIKAIAKYSGKNADGRNKADAERDYFEEYRQALKLTPIEAAAEDAAEDKDKPNGSGPGAGEGGGEHEGASA